MYIRCIYLRQNDALRAIQPNSASLRRIAHSYREKQFVACMNIETTVKLLFDSSNVWKFKKTRLTSVAAKTLTGANVIFRESLIFVPEANLRLKQKLTESVFFFK